MKTSQISGLLFLVLITGFCHAGKTSPITINPSLLNFDSLPSIQNLQIFLDRVELSPSLQQQLGYTRTGRKTKAPIVCKPSLDTVLQKSISRYLDDKKMSVSDMSAARYVLIISVLGAEITETTQGLTQTMTATLKINARLTDPQDSTKSKSYSVESQNSKMTLDTTKSAELVFRGVIEGVIKELMKSITP